MRSTRLTTPTCSGRAARVPKSRKMGGRFLDVGRFGGRCLDLGRARVSGGEMPRSGNRCLDLGMAEMDRCGYEMPRSRKICLDLGSACPLKQTVELNRSAVASL